VKKASFAVLFDSILDVSTCGLGSNVASDDILYEHCRGVKILYSPYFLHMMKFHHLIVLRI
jgi:hypothetical protein